jgi:hypothetical protein
MTTGKFGKVVSLTLYGADKEKILFETDSLRIDFEIRMQYGYSRSEIVIYNVAPEVSQLVSEDDRYCTVTASLHGGTVYTLCNKHRISNSLTEIKLPNSTTTLYGYGLGRYSVLDININTTFRTNSFKGIITEAVSIVNGLSTPLNLRAVFPTWPPEKLNRLQKRPNKPWTGSLRQLIRVLKKSYDFEYYVDDDHEITFMYLPTADDIDLTDLGRTAGQVTISTSDMRSTPQITVSSLSVVSNLDPRIRPLTIIDISKLVTASTSLSGDELVHPPGYLKAHVAGFSHYQVLSVVHTGSNYTNSWETTVSASRPTRGISHPTFNWFGRDT